MKSTKDKDKTLGKNKERKSQKKEAKVRRSEIIRVKQKRTANRQVRRPTIVLDCTALGWIVESHTLGWKGGMKKEKVGSAMLKITRVFQFLL